MKQSNIISIHLSFSFEWGILVLSVEKSNVLLLLQDERVLDCIYHKSLHVTSMIGSLIITLNPVLIAVKIDVNNLERGFVEHSEDLAIY